MLVSGYVDYGTYNSDKVNSDYSTYSTMKTQAAEASDIRSDIKSDIKPDENKNVDGQTTDYSLSAGNKAPKYSDPADFSFDFRKEKRFNLEGATRDYEDINVSKAISEMKKDSVLDKYKFFVDTPNLGTDSDGTVRIIRR